MQVVVVRLVLGHIADLWQLHDVHDLGVSGQIQQTQSSITAHGHLGITPRFHFLQLRLDRLPQVAEGPVVAQRNSKLEGCREEKLNL